MKKQLKWYIKNVYKERTMKSAWATGKRKIELIDEEYPAPGPDEVTVKVKTCGICGTDLHFYREFPGGEKIPLGHEVSAQVHQTGKMVRDLHPGDRVIVQNHIPCGRCRACLQGDPYRCQDIQTYMDDRSAMAEFLKVNRSMLVPFWGLDYAGASVAEPLTVAFDLIREVELKPFQQLLISGLGIIGLFCIRLARIGGAEKVIALGRHHGTARGKKRAEEAFACGADRVFDTEDPDWGELLEKEFPVGFHRIIVTSPPRTIPPLLPLLSFGGTIVYNGISFSETDITFDANAFHFKKLKLKASHAIPNWGFPLALESLARGTIDYRPLVTHTYPFSELLQAFEAAANPDEGAIKVLVTFED